MKVRCANDYDIPVLVAMCKAFVEESQWGWTFHKRRTLETIEKYMEGEDTEVLIVENTIPVGFALIAYDEDFQEERVGYITKFYIAKNGRGSRAGRELCRAMCGWFDYHGCVHSFATATARIGEDKVYSNLLAKYGFKPSGGTFVRGHNEQI